MTKARIDWSKVDWRQCNENIAEELGCSYNYVSLKRHGHQYPHNKPRKNPPRGRRMQFDWGSVDWARKDAEIAALLGTSKQNVNQRRNQILANSPTLLSSV